MPRGRSRRLSAVGLASFPLPGEEMFGLKRRKNKIEMNVGIVDTAARTRTKGENGKVPPHVESWEQDGQQPSRRLEEEKKKPRDAPF